MDLWLEVQEAVVLMISPVFWPGVAIGSGLIIFFSIIEMFTAELR